MTKMVIRGDKKVEARFRGIESRAKDITPVWPIVGNYLSSRVNRQFLTNGAYFGTPWKKLTPAYRIRKARMGFPTNRILVATGALKRQFTGRPMDIEEYYPHRARFGSNEPLAKWHHRGTTRNGKRVNPPRRILVVTREMRRDVKDIVARYIIRMEL